jgi:hypothetical protein
MLFDNSASALIIALSQVQGYHLAEHLHLYRSHQKNFSTLSGLMLKALMACCRIIIMRKALEMMGMSTTAKNGHERVITDRDNIKHLEYFMNGQWRHSDNCKDFTNKECTLKTVKNSLH